MKITCVVFVFSLLLVIWGSPVKAQSSSMSDGDGGLYHSDGSWWSLSDE